MGLQDIYAFLGTLLLATAGNAADIQAELGIEGHNNELLQMIFKQLEMMGNRTHNGASPHSQTHTELASALLQVAPVITIKGNITDPTRRYTISFTVQATQNKHFLDSDADDDDDDDDEGYDWRGTGGLLNPIVDVVEPYVVSFAELVLNGVLSSVISNFLQSTAMLGDTRLV